MKILQLSTWPMTKTIWVPMLFHGNNKKKIRKIRNVNDCDNLNLKKKQLKREGIFIDQ